MKEEYYIEKDSLRYYYPYEADRRITEKDYGVLTNYIGKKFTREEMDQIISEMVLKHPYVSNAKGLHLAVMRNHSYYHILDFRNYDYENQERGDVSIRYEN